MDLPILSADAKQSLDKEVTLEEIIEVISQLPNNKSASPDGFSAEFYKKCRNHLVPIIQRLIKSATTQNKFPPTMYEASIV